MPQSNVRLDEDHKGTENYKLNLMPTANSFLLEKEIGESLQTCP